MYEALKGRNLNPDGIETMAYKRPVKSFTEIHIEQGKGTGARAENDWYCDWYCRARAILCDHSRQCRS